MVEWIVGKERARRWEGDWEAHTMARFQDLAALIRIADCGKEKKKAGQKNIIHRAGT